MLIAGFGVVLLLDMLTGDFSSRERADCCNCKLRAEKVFALQFKREKVTWLLTKVRLAVIRKT